MTWALLSWAAGLCVLLNAGAAHAEKGSEVYATVEGWEIRAARDKSHCSMESWFTNKETGGTEGLLILYHPDRKSIVLSWGTSEELGVPPNEYVDLPPHFHQPLGNGRSWLKRFFHLIHRWLVHPSTFRHRERVSP